VIPLALVGMSYREAPSAVRAGLVAMDSGAEGPAAQLLEAGEITGVVRIESCARVEWLLASARPSWAAEPLNSLSRRLHPPQATMSRPWERPASTTKYVPSSTSIGS